AFGVSPLCFVGQRRNAAVGSDDHRRAQAEGNLRLAAVEAELRELVVRLGPAALGGGLWLERARPVLGGLFWRVELLGAELARTFQRCDGCVGPDALQVRVAVGRARLCPRGC